uniref:GAF domain-containing protein n=1 Tax=Alexandrium monilatum TaxID=311494 RepID=A0A7S4VC91_9DINO
MAQARRASAPNSGAMVQPQRSEEAQVPTVHGRAAQNQDGATSGTGLLQVVGRPSLAEADRLATPGPVYDSASASTHEADQLATPGPVSDSASASTDEDTAPGMEAPDKAASAEGAHPSSRANSPPTEEDTVPGMEAPDGAASAEGAHPSSRATSPLTDEEHQALLRRLWRSDELILQLKHIVKAQHGKITELRERAETAERGVRGAMREQDFSDMDQLKEENEVLRRAANQLRLEQAKLKSDNDTLRKANRRMKAMLAQEPNDWAFKGNSFASVDFTHSGSMESAAKETPPERTASRLEASSQPLGASFTPPSTSTPTRPRIPTSPSTARSSKPGTARGGRPASSLPAYPKAWRLVSSIPLFWRDMESPSSVLHALHEVCERLFSDRPNTALTLYVADPFVRLEALGGPEAKVPPTLFYLGQGRTELQVFPARRCSSRPEAPRFADLQALPYRTRSALAVAVQMPNLHRTFAVIQAACITEDPQSGVAGGTTAAKQGPKPKFLKGNCDAAEPVESGGFTDAQLAHMQMVCNLAASSLFYIERLEQREHMLERQRACVEVAIAINKARNLADFEQRLKHLLGPFFSANTVRILFYDSDNQRLLMPSAAMRRKDYLALSLDRGIVGLCAKKRAIVNVPNVSHHPFVDAMADGIQRSGRPVASNAPTMCGPLVVEADEGNETGGFLGVVQLLERRKKVAEGEFSSQEQELFRQLLQVFAHVGWRALKTQELAARLEGNPTAMMRLLMG